MPKSPLTVLLTALAALTLATACNKEKSPAAGAGSASAAACPGEVPPDTVVARIGERSITARELDERLKEPLANLDKQKYQLRKQGLEGYVVEQLVQAEAKKRNLTEEQYLKAEVDDKVPTPSDEEMKKVFEDAKGRLPPEATYEQMRPQIVEFLTGQQKGDRARALFEDLKKQANVQLSLPPMPVERKEVAATGPSKGPEGAPITIVEFSDFQCPYCGKAATTVDQVMKEYEGKVRLVFRHFPLEFHKEAPKAAEAAMCAGDQGKFWEYHDTLFQNQKQLAEDALKGYAKTLGLDAAKFDECLASGKHGAQVKADMEAGQKVGVSGTPAFFINGVMLSGAQPIEEFKSIIDQELQQAQAKK